MKKSRLDQIIIGAVALHSIILGICMLLWPVWTLGLIGWTYEGDAFFPAQSGIFLLILGGAYTAAIWNQSFAWFLVATKTTAVLFLVGQYLIGSGPPIFLLQALLDGLMGLAVAAALIWDYQNQRKLRDQPVETHQSDNSLQ